LSDRTPQGQDVDDDNEGADGECHRLCKNVEKEQDPEEGGQEEGGQEEVEEEVEQNNENNGGVDGCSETFAENPVCFKTSSSSALDVTRNNTNKLS